MSPKLALKGMVERLPESVGRPLSRVPHSVRLGPQYPRSVQAIRDTEQAPVADRERVLLERLQDLLVSAVRDVDFYREFYAAHGFRPEDVRELKDWERVPIVTKADLAGVPLARRTARGGKGLVINTGGTSGQTLEFMLDGGAFAREWAHMHHIWKARGYRTDHLKLTFRGKHFDRSEPIRYNAVHNEYVVNSSCPMTEVVAALGRLPERRVIRWLHGYPSFIADFAHALAGDESGLRERMRSRLFGALLGSEYPIPAYREVIEGTLTRNTVSWYGHSEMAILARETATGVYESLPSYGYSEAVAGGGEGAHRLVCTSLHNRLHPFIRYDTGDLVEPVRSAGGTLAFKITQGRAGDFILNRQGHRIALTGMIFGRHHRAFGLMQHLQVRDDGGGKIAIVVTPLDGRTHPDELRAGLDLDDLDIDWHIELVDQPVRSKAGKIRLKIG